MPLVHRTDSVLIVVDAQPGFVDSPGMGERDRAVAAHTVDRIAWLVRVAALLDVPALVVEEGANRHGATHDRISRGLAADTPVMCRDTFALTGCRDAVAALRGIDRHTVVVTGFETDICVAQSAVTLNDSGYRVIVPEDAIYSTREDEHRRGLARMSAAGVEIHSIKSVTLEWCEDVHTAKDTLRRAMEDFDVLPWRL